MKFLGTAMVDEGLINGPAMDSLVANAVGSMTGKQKDAAQAGVVRAVMKALDTKTTLLVQRHVEDFVSEEIQRRSDEIRSRIAGAVNARWEDAVEKIVEARLAAAVSKIKSEMLK